MKKEREISFTKLIIFYFSGTGNAKYIAEEIIHSAQDSGLDTTIFNISDEKFEIPHIKDNTLIGFCSPTHGFNLPPIMLKFIRKFKKRTAENVKVFILNTRAGMKFLKLYTPGLSGISLILPALILRLKAYKIAGLQPMDMPSNWISLHPGIRKKVLRSITVRCTKITKRFTEKIIRGRNIYKGLISLPIDLAVLPISVAYYFIGRFCLAKTFIATDKCNHCGLCIKQCPVNAISEVRGVNYWSFNCESCMNCMNSCPKRAIETAHAYTFLVWWLIFSVISNLITNYLFGLDYFKDMNTLLKEQGIYNIILIGLTFLTIFISYKFLHCLMKFKLFNRIIAFSSLTRYRFWRRYKFSRSLINSQ